jgi:hypothetical protein
MLVAFSKNRPVAAAIATGLGVASELVTAAPVGIRMLTPLQLRKHATILLSYAGLPATKA